MNEYIDKETLAKFIANARKKLPYESKDFFTRDGMLLNFEQIVRTTPAADVEPVRHGEWEFVPETLNTYSQYRCTVCGWWTLDPSIKGAYHYCPNCGAKMDNEENAL